MWKEIERLRRATVGELRTKYLELFGQPSRSNHKQFLFRRIAWRLQALAYGELSEQARQRALALAQDVDLRIKAPAHLVGTAATGLAADLQEPAQTWSGTSGFLDLVAFCGGNSKDSSWWFRFSRKGFNTRTAFIDRSAPLHVRSPARRGTAMTFSGSR